MKKMRLTIILIICLSVLFGVAANAANQSARLYNALKTVPFYNATSVERLKTAFTFDRKNFDRDYKNRYVIVEGEIREGSVSKNGKQITLYKGSGSENVILEVSDSNLITEALGLKTGDLVAVYGKVKLSGVLGDSFKITVDKFAINRAKTFSVGKYYTSDGTEFVGKSITDIADKEYVTYEIPSTWSGQNIETTLTNNDIHGHQYSLNALAPVNKEYPEIFYIFYFTNETYLSHVPAKISGADYRKIETLIVKNIMQDIEDKVSVKIMDLETASGQEFDYCEQTHRIDGKDYHMEFVFIPDEKGITVAMYLYFPKEEAINHLNEAVYVLESVKSN